MQTSLKFKFAGGIALALSAVAAVAAVFVPDAGSHILAMLFDPHVAGGLALASAAGGVELKTVMDALDKIEKNMDSQSKKADQELKDLGKVTADTKTALETLGTQQREQADRLVQLEQKGVLQGPEEKPDNSWGAQFVKAASVKSFQEGGSNKVRVEVKNTVVTSDATVAPDRRPGVLAGSFRNLTIEDLLASSPTSSNAVEWTRENVFTNNAAEVAEGAQKPETSITFTLENMPVQTVAHWIKVSRQLAMDNPALTAYINTRMRYGVNLRVENQLVNGNGTSPNIKGLLATGNFTAHGYTAANLTSAGMLNNRFDLLGLTIGDAWAADYPADGILMNPVDWFKTTLTKNTDGTYVFSDPGMATQPRVWGLPVAISNAVPAGTVIVGAFQQAATVYNREGVVVEMSESDADNFTKNLITIRAERRLMLAVERPVSIRAGLLVPA